MNTYTKNIVTIIIALGIFVIGDNIASAIWSQPTSAPPGGNVAVPVHTGTQTQDKPGWLTLDSIGTRGTALFATSGGNVGIGTANPTIAPLHVKNNSEDNAAPDILIERASVSPTASRGSPRLMLTDTYLGSVDEAPSWGIDNWADRFRIFRQPNNTTPGVEFMTVLKNGNVGIGTANPQNAKLHVNGAVLIDTPGAGSILRFRDPTKPLGQRNFQIQNAQTGLSFGANNEDWTWKNFGPNVRALTITPDDNVGIGTASPQAKLHVDGDIYAPKAKSLIQRVRMNFPFFSPFGSAGVSCLSFPSTFSAYAACRAAFDERCGTLGYLGGLVSDFDDRGIEGFCFRKDAPYQNEITL